MITVHGDSSSFVPVEAVVVEGYGIASGAAHDPRVEGGTIRAQMPHFARRGLDLSGCYPGTLNLKTVDVICRLTDPSLTFDAVRWHPEVVETFSFSPCRIRFRDTEHDGWIYYPHPETKPDHFHPPEILEVIATRIEGIERGSSVTLYVPREDVTIEPRR